MDVSRILLKHEIGIVVSYLQERRYSSLNSWQNLIIFRLASGCGLRCQEICGLNTNDIHAASEFPVIRIRKMIAKGSKARVVPLWWDTGTREDILEWLEYRSGKVPLLCHIRKRSYGQRLHEHLTARRFKTAIKCLGPERMRRLSIHDGRHSFCSHALVAGRSLAEVRDAAGHASVATTDIYVHVVARLNSNAADLYS